jgi:hypothetical protein
MLDIKIHIVTPIDRREKVKRQIVRPVFAVMKKDHYQKYVPISMTQYMNWQMDKDWSIWLILLLMYIQNFFTMFHFCHHYLFSFQGFYLYYYNLIKTI